MFSVLRVMFGTVVTLALLCDHTSAFVSPPSSPLAKASRIISSAPSSTITAVSARMSATTYAPVNVQAAWDNHLAAFGGRDVSDFCFALFFLLSGFLVLVRVVLLAVELFTSVSPLETAVLHAAPPGAARAAVTVVVVAAAALTPNWARASRSEVATTALRTTLLLLCATKTRVFAATRL